MFMLGCGDMEATREVGERALTAVGIHVAEGVMVWEVVLMVEKQVSLPVSLTVKGCGLVTRQIEGICFLA